LTGDRDGEELELWGLTAMGSEHVLTKDIELKEGF
jgi:hypothetical protein